MQTTATEVLDALNRVFEYWYLKPGEGELDRAWAKFCVDFNLRDFFGDRPAIDAMCWAEEEFEEWYLLSYRLTRGGTPLQRYLDLRLPSTPDHLRRELRALARSEHFGVFGIEECRGSDGTVCLRDLYTGKRYPFSIAELGGSIEANTVCLRIAEICGGWHAVGAFIQFLPDRYLQVLAVPNCPDLIGGSIERLPRQVGFVEVGRLMALSMSRYVRESDYHDEEPAPGPDCFSEMHQILRFMREEEMTDSCA